MANSYFKFKRFTVQQDQCAMKVGTDGVLLGAWANVKGTQHILDIGTGTGLIALMLAQRCEAKITALEIDSNAARQAQTNVSNSPWKNRIEVIHENFKQYQSDQLFDAIVSNPPYFQSSLNSPDEGRTLARHTDSLSYPDLFSGVSLLLHTEGEFSLIIPTDNESLVKVVAKEYNLFPSRQLNIITSPGKTPKRSLISFVFHKNVYEINEMLVEKERHQYSDEYIQLTQDFYLNM